MNSNRDEMLRRTLERIFQYRASGGWVTPDIYGPRRALNDEDEMRQGCSIGAGFAYPASSQPPELQPLPTHKQLALSVLLDEEVSAFVLMSALEDAGVLGAGAITAAEDGPLDVAGQPLYDGGESSWDSWQRHRRELGPWCDGQQSHVYGLCRGVLGGGSSVVGRAFSRFLDAWLGARQLSGGGRQWPTTEYMLARRDAFPTLLRVFRHLRPNATPALALDLDRLIAHLERRS